jgi:outer membrane protein assembly factor BamB
MTLSITPRWERQQPKSARGIPLNDKLIFFGEFAAGANPASNHLYVVDWTTGQLLWQVALPGMDSDPLVYGNMGFVRRNKREILALDLTNGAVKLIPGDHTGYYPSFIKSNHLMCIKWDPPPSIGQLDIRHIDIADGSIHDQHIIDAGRINPFNVDTLLAIGDYNVRTLTRNGSGLEDFVGNDLLATKKRIIEAFAADQICYVVCLNADGSCEMLAVDIATSHVKWSAWRNSLPRFICSNKEYLLCEEGGENPVKIVCRSATMVILNGNALHHQATVVVTVRLLTIALYLLQRIIMLI